MVKGYLDLLCIQMLPGDYDIVKAYDGNGTKLSQGAHLKIQDTDSDYYLDFTEPTNTPISFDLRGFFIINLVFLILAALIYIGLCWYKRNLQ